MSQILLAWLGLGLALVCLSLRVKNRLGCILRWVHLDLLLLPEEKMLLRKMTLTLLNPGNRSLSIYFILPYNFLQLK